MLLPYPFLDKCPFYTQYKRCRTRVFLCGRSFLTYFRKVTRAEEASNDRNCVKMVVVHQIHVNTGSFVGSGTGDKFVAQSGADHYHTYPEHFFKCLHIVQNRWSI